MAHVAQPVIDTTVLNATSVPTQRAPHDSSAFPGPSSTVLTSSVPSGPRVVAMSAAGEGSSTVILPVGENTTSVTASDSSSGAEVGEVADRVDSLTASLEGLSVGEVLAVVESGLRQASGRLSAPDAVEEFTRHTSSSIKDSPADAAECARSSVPALLQTVKTLMQEAGSVQAKLDGFIPEVFEAPKKRAELLGLPEKGKLAYRGPADFLRDTTNVSHGEAARRAKQAEHFQPHLAGADSSSAKTPPRLPAVSTGFANAGFGADRLGVITAALEKIDATGKGAGLDQQTVTQLLQADDQALAQAATTDSYAGFKAMVARWRENIIAAITDLRVTTVEEQAYEQRGMRYLGKKNGIHQWLVNATAELHEALLSVDSAANNPRAQSNQAAARAAAENPEPEEGVAGSVWDRRSKIQRCHDGIDGVVASGLGAKNNGLPDQGGARPHGYVTVDIITMLRVAYHQGLLADDFDPALLELGDAQDALISAGYSGTTGPGILRRLLCTADIFPVVMDGNSQVLDSGTSNRLFSPAQRRALIARDGGCAAPGCTFPASWCEVHHIQHWKSGGPTNLANAVQLCSHHHRMVHENYWTITIQDNTPWFTPTQKFIGLADADRGPRRNTIWRPTLKTNHSRSPAPDADPSPGDQSAHNQPQLPAPAEEHP